jgi:hypothetical protein
MSQEGQLKSSLRRQGLNLDYFSGGEKLTSKLLERICGGTGPVDFTHEKNIQPIHSRYSRAITHLKYSGPKKP